ncbi:MAG: DNA replication/repair protein RecF [Lysobacteraceae bacterium]
MRVERLRIEHLRLIDAAEIAPGPSLNLFTGANGAGKTTVLEAIHVLAYGRSFRSTSREALVARGNEWATIHAELRSASEAALRRIGFACSARNWQARVDGENVSTLGEVLRHCPVVCFEPGSHALIAGGSEHRRRFVDWGLFHVEQEFLPVWRRYHRALKQRNALLKSAPSDAELAPWDSELAEWGEALHALRQNYVDALSAAVAEMTQALMPEAGVPSLHYQPGWRHEREPLAQALAQARGRDRATGHSSVGPHRANWSLGFEALPGREVFSRGQEKLAALICVLAQAEHFAGRRGEWPLIALDDLGSELDRNHQARAIETVAERPAQVWITGVETPHGLDAVAAAGLCRFHVEQGVVQRLG